MYQRDFHIVIDIAESHGKGLKWENHSPLLKMLSWEIRQLDEMLCPIYTHAVI
jgi:hypothetical protein